MDNHQILGIIPARGGSKRIPGKNLKKLCGKSLLSWTIETAKQSVLENLFISTDDKAIADEAKKHGVEVPFLRSPDLSSDESNVVDAIEEALYVFEEKGIKYEAVLLLQPTSPFRSVETINSAIEKFKSSNGESVISLNPSQTHPYWCKKVEDGEITSFIDGLGSQMYQSQDLPSAYQLNGLIYMASTFTITNSKSFYSKHTQALIIDSQVEAVDIDTEYDWLVAEAIARQRGLTC